MATIADQRRGFEKLTIPAMLWVIVCLLRTILFSLVAGVSKDAGVRASYIKLFADELDSFTWRGEPGEPPDEL